MGRFQQCTGGRESGRDPGGEESDGVGGLGAPGAAASFAMGQTGCPGCGGTCWPQGCGDARLPREQPVSSPAGAVPATGFLKQSGINIDSKGFIVVNKVSVGAAPASRRAGGAGAVPGAPPSQVSPEL